jgi:hypothetical protein
VLTLIQKRHGRTFSEDERIEAQNKVKKIEEDESTEISEQEDPMMLARDAKDWKVGGYNYFEVLSLTLKLDSRSLCCPWSVQQVQVPLESYAGADQERSSQESSPTSS